MKRTMAVFGFALLAGGAANAADVYAGGGSLKDAPAPILVQSWTGFYIGIGAQGDSVNHVLKAHEAYTDGDYAYAANAELNGLSGIGAGFSITVGADYQLPGSKLVFGVGGDYDVPSASTTLTASDSDGNSLSGSYDMTGYWTAWGRAGVLFTPSTLVYAKIGYGEATFHPGGDLAKVVATDQTYSGLLVGGGIETRLDALWSGATLRLEYTNLMADTATLYASKDGTFTLTNTPDIQSVKAIIAVKFGETAVPLK